MQKNKIWERVFLGLLLFILCGSQLSCGAKERISLEEMTGEMQTEQEKEEKTATGKDEDAKESAEGQETKPAAQTGEGSGTDPAPGMLSVYVCGAVHAPGVYELPAGSRLYQAIDAAGGMREDADKNYLNLAMELVDGEKLQVPTQEEVLAGAFGAERTEMAEQASGNGSSASKEGASGLVNINTADETLLMTLPGIGEAKAKSIIAYRTDKGSFAKVEDIMNIPGIKQAVYDKIKDVICVN